TLGRSGKLGDGDGRSVGSEDGVALRDLIERGVDFLLGLDVLDDRFDNDVAVSQILAIGRALQPAANLLALFGGDAAFLCRLTDELVQRLLNGSEALVEEALLGK